MKTYLDFMLDISSDELYKGLLGFGLFSEKIPPLFSSEMFYKYCISNNPKYQKHWNSFVQYDSMRNTNVVRELGIPTPMTYQNLCACLRDNWPKLQKHFEKCTKDQSYNISRTHLRKMFGTPMLFKMNYENWKDDGSPEQDLLIGSRYIVRADISKCFPSIYTHSLPWALAGKSNAKSKAGKKPEIWYNEIDHMCENCNYGETHGLLIGPHASNLLSEVILTAIDKELSNKGWKYTRYIDDYTCYVDSFEKAQLFIVDLNTELKKYDLSLNDRKTEIEELPIAVTKQWKRQVENTKPFYRNGSFDYKSARSYFDNAIEIMQKNSENAAILNYAIKSIPVEDMTEQAKKLCVKTFFHLCLLYPYLVHIMDEFVFERLAVSQDDIEAFTNQLYTQELAVKNYDAVCYALFFARKYGFCISSLSSRDAIESNSCIFKLLAFLVFKAQKNDRERKALRDHALQLKTIAEDLERNWLFVYEVLPQSELPGDWKTMKNDKISFIKEAYQV